MAFGYFIATLLAAAVAVFALQNSAQTSVRFLVWTLRELPLAAVALASLAVGLIVAGVPLWIRSWRWHSRARSAEARVALLENALAAARAQTSLQQREHPAEPPGSRSPPV